MTIRLYARRSATTMLPLRCWELSDVSSVAQAIAMVRKAEPSIVGAILAVVK